jgi:hypothetical protein
LECSDFGLWNEKNAGERKNQGEWRDLEDGLENGMDDQAFIGFNRIVVNIPLIFVFPTHIDGIPQLFVIFC